MNMAKRKTQKAFVLAAIINAREYIQVSTIRLLKKDVPQDHFDHIDFKIIPCTITYEII